MSADEFYQEILALKSESELLRKYSPQGKPEETTKDRLLIPFLEALGYHADARTPEANIRSLLGTTHWVDYLLKSEKKGHPFLMLEAKSLWDNNIWEKHKKQVLEYLRDYSLSVGIDEPVLWLVLSNFREWYIVRLQDKEPFWRFTIDELAENSDLSAKLFSCLARENIKSDRLQALYSEQERKGLDARFLADLKLWRLIIANGIKINHPELSLQQIKEASGKFLDRFILIRLLETFSREMSFNYLGRIYDNWQKTFNSLPFINQLRQGFQDTWLKYNTDLFQESWIDHLQIDPEYLEPILLNNYEPSEEIKALLPVNITEYRSIYNYDFTTLTQDIQGKAYEQFLAHQLIEEDGKIKILENQKTRQKEGIFYTPDYIVKRIVYQTLQPLIKPKIELAISQLQAKDYQTAYQTALSVFEITICDPACGSGSFLLGAFDYIISEVKRYNQVVSQIPAPTSSVDLFSYIAPQSISNVEELIVVKMLYGVDKDPQAVLKAKLSLWIRLLRAKPGEYGRKNGLMSRLPALNLNLKVGDSLIHSPAKLNNYYSEISKIAKLVKQIQDPRKSESNKHETIEKIDKKINEINKEINLVLIAFFASDESLQSVIKQIKNQEAETKELNALREFLIKYVDQAIISQPSDTLLANWTIDQLQKLKSELIILSHANTEMMVKRPFNWLIEFPHIFDPSLPESERGFTAIIGNPPYFNIDATFGKGAPELRWLKFAYDDIYTDKTDILFYFLRWGYELLQENGELSFIISRAFIQGDKSQKLRSFLSQKTQLVSLIDFLGNKVFQAGIATAIIQFKKVEVSLDNPVFINYILDLEKVKKMLIESLSLEQLQNESSIILTFNVTQRELQNDRWQVSPYLSIFQIIDSVGTKLRDSAIIDLVEQGIQTGENNIFVSNNFPRNFPQNKLYSRVTNSGILSYGFLVNDEKLLYIENNDNFNSFTPSLQDYLNQHQKSLEKRAACQEGSCQWYALHRSRRKGKHHHFRPKILCPYRASSNRFTVDIQGNLAGLTDTTAIFLKDIYIYSENDPKLDQLYALCALLNSKVLEFRYRVLGGLGKLTSKGMFEYFENQISDLPIPSFDSFDNNPQLQQLASLAKEAHQIFQQCYQLIKTYHSKSSSIPYQEVSANYYHNILGQYGVDIEVKSLNPNQEGHLLKLQIKPTDQGYQIFGEITDDEDWKTGERQIIEIAEVIVKNLALRRFLLARFIYLTEFDPNFQRKQKLTNKPQNLLKATWDVLTVYRYDTDREDRFDNLRVLEIIEQRVQAEIGLSEIETLLLRQQEIYQEIDAIAYDIYNVKAYQNMIKQALS